MFTLNGATQSLNKLLGKENLNATCYIALSTTEPNIQGANVTEPKGNNYARASTKDCMGNVALTSDFSTSEISNIREIHFQEATGSWGTITHFALYNSATGGTPLYVGALTEPITPTANTVPLIKVGQLKITLK